MRSPSLREEPRRHPQRWLDLIRLLRCWILTIRPRTLIPDTYQPFPPGFALQAWLHAIHLTHTSPVVYLPYKSHLHVFLSTTVFLKCAVSLPLVALKLPRSLQCDMENL